MSNWKVFHPERFQGAKKRNNYFEGWYFKIAMHDEVLCLIPGISLSNDSHAFIQVVSSSRNKPWYVRFPLSSFHSDENRFLIRIGENTFSREQVHLRLQEASLALDCAFTFSDVKEYPVTLSSPGIMGWYAWVPRMECYHGVLSFSHSLQGTLTLNGKVMDFSGGRGYIEKDWGQSFPAAWVWLQSNHFAGVDACITASVAIIPWVGNAFRGFIAGLWLDGTLHRFATYSGARIENLQIFDDHVDWVLRNHQSRLFLKAYRVQGGLLRGPTRLDMGQRVLETLNATVQVRLETLQGEVLFDAIGAHTGLEVMGDLPRLLQG